MSEEYLSMSAIKQTYGITLSAFKLIGEPDKLVVNPIYKCAAPMKMYSTSRIEAFLRTDEYKAWKEKNIKRTNASKKAIETKQAKLDEQWNSIKGHIKINWPKDFKTLKNKTLKAKQEWYIDTGEAYTKDYDAYSCTDENTIKRWCLNYIRHNCTTYDLEIENFYKKFGVNQIIERLHNYIEEEALKRYEELR